MEDKFKEYQDIAKKFLKDVYIPKGVDDDFYFATAERVLNEKGDTLVGMGFKLKALFESQGRENIVQDIKNFTGFMLLMNNNGIDISPNNDDDDETD